MAGEGIFNMATAAQKGQRNVSKYDGMALNTVFNMQKTEDYLSFTAVAVSTISVTNNIYSGTLPAFPDLQYSMNGADWETFSSNTVLNLNDGESVRFKGINSHMTGYGFHIEGSVTAGGSIMSLIDGIGILDTAPEPVNQRGCFEFIFKNSTGLLNAPRLPKVLSSRCLSGAFYNCTNMTRHGDIVSETVPTLALYGTFEGCSSLVSAGDIKARTIGYEGCSRTYYGCSSLVTAGNIYAEYIEQGGCSEMYAYCSALETIQESWNVRHIGNYGCHSMYMACTSLVESARMVPLFIGEAGMAAMYSGDSSLEVLHDLPCMNLGKGAYNAMCSNCTSLVAVPDELPCINLPDGDSTYNQFGVYQATFYGCTSMTVSPRIKAKIPAAVCCYRMYYGCSSLQRISSDFIEWNDNLHCTTDWVHGVAASGTFIGCGSMIEEHGDSRIPDGWVFDRGEEVPLFFRCPSQCDITLNGFYSYISPLPQLMTSTDMVTWHDWDYTQGGITVPAGGHLFVKNKEHNDFTSIGQNLSLYFGFTSDVYAGGNVISLLDDDYGYEVQSNYALSRLFYSASHLKSMPSLPHYVEDSAYGVFEEMFMQSGIEHCDVSFVKKGTYNDKTCSNMFSYCTSLLSAKVGNIECDRGYMFYASSALSEIDVDLKQWGDGIHDYSSLWVGAISQAGTFKKPSELPEYYGTSNIPSGWTVINK